jgi:antitoxin (DNA-binding transcriptional repressor) of toxin-antitoxin stability system
VPIIAEIRPLVQGGSQAGETLTETRDGDPVAELRSLAKRPLRAERLIERQRVLPSVDSARFRADIDHVLDAEL